MIFWNPYNMTWFTFNVAMDGQSVNVILFKRIDIYFKFPFQLIEDIRYKFER